MQHIHHQSFKYKITAIGLLLAHSLTYGATQWWWNTTAPKNNNTTLSIKAGITGSATKSVTINSTSNTNTRFSQLGSLPYVIVQSGPGLVRTRVVFTTSQRWYPPKTVYTAKLFMIGGGGGGGGGHYPGGADWFGGHGGGAGLIFESTLDLGYSGSGTYCDITIGAGGTGGANTNANGTDGGNTSISCTWAGALRVGKVVYGGTAGSSVPGGGSAYGGAGQKYNQFTTAIPSWNWVCPHGAYGDSDISGTPAAPTFLCKKGSSVDGGKSIYYGDNNTKNVSAGGGGGYYGTIPDVSIGDSQNLQNVGPTYAIKPYGKGGHGYFGVGGDGGYGGSSNASFNGASGTLDNFAMIDYKPSQGWGAGGNGGTFWNAGRVRTVTGGGGGGYLGFPGVPAPPAQSISTTKAMDGTQGIVVIEY